MKPETKDYEVRIWYSPEPGDECFVAQVLDLPGVMAHGETREAAAREIQIALQHALETNAEAGERPVAKNHAAVALGSLGGSARSKIKRRAAKHNGALGGRPRKALVSFLG